MSKISELGPILGINTRSEDLFVIVNLIQGDDGTKNITRKELVEAIQYEVFSHIEITGGTIRNVQMFTSELSNVTINDSVINRNTINDSTLNNSQIYVANAEDVTGLRFDLSNSSIHYSDIDNTTFTDGSIFDSTANNVTITSSYFLDGNMARSSGNNMTFVDSTIDNSIITASEFNDGTANNVVIRNSTFTNGDMYNSTGNNMVFTNSTIDDSTFNNMTIEGAVANNFTITNLNLDEVVMTDVEISRGTIDSVDIANATFIGGLTDVTIANAQITDSDFSNGTGNNVTFTNLVDSTILRSDFSDGTGSNNVFTDTTIEAGVFRDGVIANTTFQGGLNDVTIDDATITDSNQANSNLTDSTFRDGTIEDTIIKNSKFDGAIERVEIANSVIIDSQLINFDVSLDPKFEPMMDDESYFVIRNALTGKTEQLTYKQLNDELGKTTEKALKVHVAVDGDDNNPGSILKPVRTLARASELAIEKAGGNPNRNDINNAIHISVGPGTYYVDEPIVLPDDCALTSTAGQYATVIQKKPGWERTNGIQVGSGCYVQGFGYMNFEVDNFDNPEGGFAIVYRPGALLRRSPYIRDSSQLSNFNRLDVEPPLNPFNSKGTIADLGQEFYLEAGHSPENQFEVDDEVTFSSGASGYISWTTDINSNRQIYVRNLKGNVEVGDTLYAQTGGTGVIERIGIDDFPNRLVGRGGGCALMDRAVLDTDSLYTYLLCFGFTPRTQNGTGYVAKNGAGVNGIGSLSIFTRQAFFALNGGQVTLNNSGSQFGDISMRAKGKTTIVKPAVGTESVFIANSAFGDLIEEKSDDIVNDMIAHLTANTASGGLGYQGYNADKCFRDTGIIVDNVGYDVATNSNYWGRLNGITYRSPISYVVVNEQLTETVGSIEHLKDEMIDGIFVNANTQIQDRISTSLDETLNVLQNGEPLANPITFADTGVGTRTGAREVVQDNREFIIEEFMDWMDNNPDFFAYDSDKCKRDVREYILPAVKYDTMLDTNYNSITAGYAYYFNATRNVAGAQRDETVAAYQRLRDTTDDLVQANSAAFAAEAYYKFNNVIDILKQSGTRYDPTDASYDPATGDFTVTIGTHGLEVGNYILLMPEGFTFTCDTDGNKLEFKHPRKSDPAFKSAMPITAKTATTITVNVGSTGYTGVHTFVDALDGSVIEMGETYTFSDDAGITAANRNARKQLQSNKGFIQDYMMDWADDEWFFYDSKKCQRDTNAYIVPAVLRDMQLGTNFNSVQNGIAYRQAITSVVPDSQLSETVGAFSHLRDEISETLTDNIAIAKTEEAFNEIIGIMQKDGREYTPTNATYNPTTGESVITIENHEFEIGDMITLAKEGLTFYCANTATGANTSISHPRATDPAYQSPLQITAATDTTITVYVGDANGYTGAHTFQRAKLNAVKQYANVKSSHTPTTATYNPTTGIMVATIGDHNIQPGDTIVMDKESITFSCANTDTLVVTNISHPRVTDPAFNSLTQVTSVTANTITIDVGAVPNGYAGAHTFVSASSNAIKTISFANGRFTPSTATYDPITGIFTATIGEHNLVVGDKIKIADESITFSCGSPAEEISHPRSTDPASGAELVISAVTDNTITVNVGNAGTYTGAHTFVSAQPFAITLATPYNGKYTPSNATYDPQTGDMTVDIGQHNLRVGKWISIADESITFSCANGAINSELSHPRVNEPAFRQPVRITGVTGTAITFNVGNAGGYANTHTFVSAETDCIDTNAIYWTDAAKIDSFHTPSTATYNPATGVMELTMGADHGFTTDDHIEFKPNSITFSCANTSTGQTIEISHPRIGEPNYQKPLAISAVTSTTITVNPGAVPNGYAGAHTFVSAEEGSVIKTRTTRDGLNAAEQLKNNKVFLQDEVDAWIRDNYFVYNDEKCFRDTGLILDSVRRDFATDSNVNSVFAGLAYRSGNASTNTVITEQLTETVGAIAWLRDEIRGNILSGTAENRANTAFNEIIDIMQNDIAAADTRTFGGGYVSDEAYEAKAILQANKQFIIDETTAWIANNHPDLTYDSAKCERDVGYFIDSVSWDIQHGSNASTVNNSRLYFDNAVSVLGKNERAPTAEAFEHISNIAGQIVRNELVFDLQQGASTQTRADNTTYTPTNATYDPTTGIMVATIGTHSYVPGDRISIAEESITFSCANGAVVTNISHPRSTDPAFNVPITITDTTSTTITVDVGAIPNGYANNHTFVSATANAIKSATVQPTYTPTNATYDPVTGIFTATIGTHRLEKGDYIIMDEEAITFSCANTATGAITQISHPRATDPYFNRPVEILEADDTTITMNVGAAPNGYAGVHYFEGSNADAIRKSAPPAIADKVNDLFKIVADMVRGNDFSELPTIVEPTLTGTGYNSAINAQFNKVWGNTPKYQEEIIQFIREEYNGLAYDTDLCYRDVGLIVDAIREDLEYGGDAATIDAAGYYFKNAVSILPYDQREPTRLAFEHLATVAESVITETTVTPTTGNSTAQNTSGTAGTSTIAATAKDLINVISGLIDDNIVIPDYAGSLDITQKVNARLDEKFPVANTATLPLVEPSRTFARKALQKNKDFIQDEVVAYINNRYFVYDEDKCARDTGYILDAVAYDVATGGDYYGKFAGKVYRAGTTSLSKVIDEQLAETVQAIEYLQADIEGRLTGTAKTRATASFNAIKDAMIYDYDPETEAYNFGTAYQNISATNCKDALQANKAFLQAEATAWMTDNYGSIVYDVDKCERDVGYMVDAVCAAVMHNSNASMRDVARVYFENGLSTLPSDQRAVTAELYERLGAMSTQIALKQPVTKSASNAASQVTTGFNTGFATQANSLTDFWTIVADIITDDSLINLPAVTRPGNSAGINYDYNNERDAIRLRTTYLAANINEYLQKTFNYLEYDQVKCRRDVGYMVDAISHDIQYGGNSAMWNAAQIYFVNAVNLLPKDQREPTRAAFTHMAEVMHDVIRNKTVPYRIGKTFTAANATYDVDSGESVITLGNHKLKVGDYILLEKESLTFSCGSPAENISHPRVTDPAFEKPLKITAVTTNTVTVQVGYAKGYQGAHTFVSATTDGIKQVIGNTSKQFKDGYTARRHIAMEAKDLAMMVANIAYDNNPTNLPARVEPFTNWIPETLIDQKNLIDDKLTTLVESMIEFISTEYKGISYPKEKCRRDVGIIVDALSHDINYSTNYAMRLVANMYFDNAVSVLPFDQRKQTADFYAEMANLVSDVAQELAIGQDTSNPAATVTQGNDLADLVRMVEEAIRRNSLDALPEIVEPDTSWVSADKIAAGRLIDNNLDELADDVTQYISDNFSIIDYSKAKCRRDSGYLIDAMSWDLNYGGNLASRWNADFYYWNGTLRIPENTRVATAQSYRQLGKIVSEVVTGSYPGQKLRPEMGSEAEAKQAYENGLIFYNALFYNTPKSLGPTIEPDFTWNDNVTKQFRFAKDILANNKVKLQREVQRFITQTYKFIDLPKTYRDGGNLLKIIANDFRYIDASQTPQEEGTDKSTRSFAAALFNIDSQHVFPVFNPPATFSDWRKLRFKGTAATVSDLANLENPKRWYAQIVPTDNNGNRYAGRIYYYNGSTWLDSGVDNNTDLLDAFTGAWTQMKSYINTNIAPDVDHINMVNELIDNVLIETILRPEFLAFGSLVESIAHQFNGASAGVNRNALPLNFRNIGSAISATASVLSEDGGRIRWSGSDELNNQFFARGLKINGRTGRIEGRPFTSSVRKLARRASNSRAVL